MSKKSRKLSPYRVSVAGTLLKAREIVMNPIRPVLWNAGVTEQQWRVLRVLKDEGSVDPSRLAQSALLRASSVTRILKELEERGLIVRGVDVRDGRRFIVTISAAGKRLVEETVTHTLVILNEYEDRFGKERLDALLAELQAFIDAIASVRPPVLGDDDSVGENDGL